MAKDYTRNKMKRLSLISAFIFSAAVVAQAHSYSFKQTYQLYNGDTINFIDINQLKQGLWIYFDSMKHLPNYKPDQIVEEGHYKDSRKIGIWEHYFPNGKMKTKINYVNNRPDGYYVVYYQNGQIQEEGIWKNDRNVGDFKRYYKNGQVSQQFHFNKTGKRQGVQKYFYDNGQLMIVGNWTGGKKTGVVKNYYENGDLKAEKVFNNGTIDAEKSVEYKPKVPIKPSSTIDNTPVEKVMATKNEKPNIGSFNGNGYAKLYNLNKQIIKDGTFKNYRLMTGKSYIYDKNGILIDIQVFQDGHLIGHAPLNNKDLN